MHSFDGFAITALETSSALKSPAPRIVLDDPDLRISAVAVPHAMMPAVAYRIEHDARTVTFSGDVHAAHAPLVQLAHGCDLLLDDLALPEREAEHGDLHGKASEVGKVPRDCGCGQLLVTHVMPELEAELVDAIGEVRRAYAGRLMVAEDLMRIVP